MQISLSTDGNPLLAETAVPARTLIQALSLPVAQGDGTNLKIQCTDEPIILAQLREPVRS